MPVKKIRSRYNSVVGPIRAIGDARRSVVGLARLAQLQEQRWRRSRSCSSPPNPGGPPRSTFPASSARSTRRSRMGTFRDAVELVLVPGAPAGRPAPQAQREPAPGRPLQQPRQPRRDPPGGRGGQDEAPDLLGTATRSTQGSGYEDGRPATRARCGGEPGRAPSGQPIGPGGCVAFLRRGEPPAGGPQRLRHPAAGRGADRGRGLRRQHEPGRSPTGRRSSSRPRSTGRWRSAARCRRRSTRAWRG